MPRSGIREGLVAALAARLPFHYGWVILACACLAGFSRQGSAVATLSIFITPMTAEFGWSRTAISSAVSVGGVLGALVAPALGGFLDRNGARAVLLMAVLLTGIPVLLLSFCLGRMSFAAPYDLGIYGSIVNWFVRRRAFATSIATLAQMAGLVTMPLLAFAVIRAADWRAAWVAIGATVLVVGFLPTFLLHLRRPEDLGLHPEGEVPRAQGGPGAARAPEPAYSRSEALATPAFWLLAAFTLCIYPVQAGISLHQAPLLIERGLSPATAAGAVSTFAFMSAVSGFAFGFWPRRVPLRFALGLVALLLATSCALMGRVHAAPQAYAAASVFGLGVGGLLTMLPIAWADYFGRASYGAIRGAALAVQVVAQASGPVISGLLRDWTGSYGASVATFAGLAVAGSAVALAARPPSK
jgi:OFA family oxalate/formate antiporter-like MFS transporter